MPTELYLYAYLAQKDIESMKDRNGDTISNSRGLLVMESVYKTKGLTDRQRQRLFGDFGVGKTVMHYNSALVAETLRKMRKD